MELDVVIEDDRWQAAGLEPLAERAVGALMLHLGMEEAELCVMGCDDARIAGLNAEFRGKPRATNVLSWPSEERGADTPGGQPHPPFDPEWGDIALAYDTCLAEAEASGRPFQDHVTHLIVHGTLHLLGYDHENEQDAVRMERLEVEILGNLGISDPYS
jgi:probable rRNA maturation factor